MRGITVVKLDLNFTEPSITCDVYEFIWVDPARVRLYSFLPTDVCSAKLGDSSNPAKTIKIELVLAIYCRNRHLNG